MTLVLAAYRRPYHDIQDFTRLRIGPEVVQDYRREVQYLSPELAPITNPEALWRSRMARLTRTSSTYQRMCIAGRVTRSSRTSVSSPRFTGRRGIDLNCVLHGRDIGDSFAWKSPPILVRYRSVLADFRIGSRAAARRDGPASLCLAAPCLNSPISG